MKTSFIFTFIISLFLGHISFAQQSSFSGFQSILDRHLVEVLKPSGAFESYFDYQGFHESDDSKKNSVSQLKILEQFDLASLKTKEQANAFWINAYNFLMIVKINQAGFKNHKLAINSVKDLGSFLNPYKVFSERDLVVSGKKMSLDDIEKGTLLGKEYKEKGWKDARIHFAVNCASVGCPPLLKKVYSAENLSEVLDQNTERALKTERHFSVDGDKLKLTHLMKWYKTDFEEHSGSVILFLNKFLPSGSRLSESKKYNYEYIPYDWNLNRAENFK